MGVTRLFLDILKDADICSCSLERKDIFKYEKFI